MRKTLGATVTVALVVLSPLTAADPRTAPPAPAAPQGAPAPSGEIADLIGNEKVRGDVEAIVADLENPDLDAAATFYVATQRLISMGSAVVPYMANELEREDVDTFHVAAFVLGQIGDPAGIEPLRKAFERTAAQEDDKLKQTMKGWTAYAMAMLGAPDIVDLLLSGKYPAGLFPWMEDMPLLEVAVQIAGPRAVTSLMGKVAGLRADPGRELETLAAIEALGGSGDPAAAPHLVAMLADDRIKVRTGALQALGQLGETSTIDAIIPSLQAKDFLDRQRAADALAQIRAVGKEKVLLARLEAENDAGVRRSLYLHLVDLTGERALEALVSHWNRPDPLDRVAVVDAAGMIGTARTANLLRGGVRDADVRVALHAMEGLARLAGPGPTDTLLALLRDPREQVSRSAVRLLASLREPRAAPRVTDLLLQDLASPRGSVSDRRDRVHGQCEALVVLGYTEPIDDLRKAVGVESDEQVKADIGNLVRRLEALRANGADPAKWAQALQSDDASIRHLARVRLGEIGGDPAAKALAASFGRGVEDDAHMLGELGRTRSGEGAALLERILTEPAFDGLAPLRTTAAYGARLLGGPRMVEALKSSAVRRQGRDVNVLVYLAQLAPKEALPLLREVRVARLRWFDWERGKEQARLDWIARRLSAGLSVSALDLPPADLAL